VLIFKTIYGRTIAAYSEEHFSSSGTNKGLAFLMPLWNQKNYYVHKGSKGITYDDYYLIFGNSEVRIKSMETKVFSNFGLRSGYFDSRGDKIE
jgi:hypothetical protein